MESLYKKDDDRIFTLDEPFKNMGLEAIDVPALKDEEFAQITVLGLCVSFPNVTTVGTRAKTASESCYCQYKEVNTAQAEMLDYALWEVIKNGATLSKIQVIEGVTTVMPITSVKNKAWRRLEVKERSTLMRSIPNEHQLKFNSNKYAKQLLEAIEKRFVNTANGVSTASTQVNTVEILSDVVICAFLASQPNSPQLAHEDLKQIHPDDIEEMDLRWKMAMLTIRAKRFLKKTGSKLTVNGNESLRFDMSKVECYNFHKRGHFARECRAPRNKDTKYKESTKRSVYVQTPASTALVSCDEFVKLLKSQNEQLLKDLKKSKLMVLGYKTGLQSVEERLEIFKKNEFIYLEDIKVLKVKIQMKDIAIKELRRKLEVAQKEKEGIQLIVEKLKNASKSLNKLIDCQIVDNYKKGLGYESYNAVPPPYTGNFMPPKPDLSYTSLDEFAVKPVVENKSREEETKAVRKNPEAPIVEEWVLDDEEENVAQPKIVKIIVKPSILKIEFVNPRQQEKTARKNVKKVEHNRKNTHKPRGN
nr:hypothetical protein [Tanacetum cinerariifolium]